MTIYQTIADLTDRAIVPALGSDDTLTPAQARARWIDWGMMSTTARRLTGVCDE